MMHDLEQIKFNYQNVVKFILTNLKFNIKNIPVRFENTLKLSEIMHSISHSL